MGTDFASGQLAAMTERRTATLIRRLFDAFEAGDMDAIAARYAEDVRWHTPGHSELAGDYVGRAQVLAQLRRYTELTDSFHVEVEDLMAGERHATSLYRVSASRLGRELDLRHMTLHAIADSAVQEVWVMPLDQVAFDTFWA
jgi:ketosteroid isomerase-like protein